MPGMFLNLSAELLKLLLIGQPNMIITSMAHPNTRKLSHDRSIASKLSGLTEAGAIA